ncbi:hypothetical protein D1872_302350 [compost metagenome]
MLGYSGLHVVFLVVLFFYVVGLDEGIDGVDLLLDPSSLDTYNPCERVAWTNMRLV